MHLKSILTFAEVGGVSRPGKRRSFPCCPRSKEMRCGVWFCAAGYIFGLASLACAAWHIMSFLADRLRGVTRMRQVSCLVRGCTGVPCLPLPITRCRRSRLFTLLKKFFLTWARCQTGTTVRIKVGWIDLLFGVDCCTVCPASKNS